MCVCGVCACIDMWGKACGDRRLMSGIFLSCFSTHCLRQTLTEPGAHWFNSTGWPGMFFCLSSTWITGTHTTMSNFESGSWGSKFRSLCSHNKHFIYYASSTSMQDSILQYLFLKQLCTAITVIITTII
jgi:hypothetical protein